MTSEARVSLRDGAPADAAAILDLWRRAESAQSVTDTVDDLGALMRNWPGSVVLAESEGAVIGSIIWQYGGWRGTLARLAVDPRFRRRGIANRLVREAEARLHAASCRRIWVLVESDHPDAMAYWRASDYEQVSHVRLFVRDTGGDA